MRFELRGVNISHHFLIRKRFPYSTFGPRGDITNPTPARLLTPPLTATCATLFTPAAGLLELPAGHGCGVMQTRTSDMAARTHAPARQVSALDRGRARARHASSPPTVAGPSLCSSLCCYQSSRCCWRALQPAWFRALRSPVGIASRRERGKHKLTTAQVRAELRRASRNSPVRARSGYVASV